MTRITEPERCVIVGVDTHKDRHVAGIIDDRGKTLDTTSIPTTSLGFRQLINWAESFGQIKVFGVEGTGSYGAGLSRFLVDNHLRVVEVNRPNRQRRRRLGKSDTVDAESAARAVLAGEGNGTPKAQDGSVETIRMLGVARRSAIKARSQVINQIRQLVITGPESLRSMLTFSPVKASIETASRFRPGPLQSAESGAKFALKSLAKQWLVLDAEITELDKELEALVQNNAPVLAEVFGVGTDVAGALLVVVGDNPERLTSEASFAALCGACPIEASSGKVQRHRLNRVVIAQPTMRCGALSWSVSVFISPPRTT